MIRTRNQFNLLLILRILLARKKIIISMFMMIAIPIYFTAGLITDVYEADVTLFIDEQPLKTPFYKEGVVLHSRTLPIDLKRQTLFLNSHTFLAKITAALDSQQVRRLTNIPADMPDSIPSETAIIKSLKNAVEFSKREPAIITVNSRTSSPSLSYELVCLITQYYIEENLKQNRQDIVAARKFLYQQQENARQLLIEAQAAAMNFKRKNEIHLQSVRIENLELNAQLNRLEHDVVLALENYNWLSKRYMESRIREEETLNNIRTVSPAVMPQEPSGSKTMKIRLLGILAGLFISITFAYAVEYLEDYINDAADLRHITDIPILGEIPYIRTL